MVRIISIIVALLLINGCAVEQGPKGDTGERGPAGKTIVIYQPSSVPPKQKVVPDVKFKDTWSDIYDSPLSTRQTAYCRSASLRKQMKSLEDWVVLVNEVPQASKGKIEGVVETQCAVLKAEFPRSILNEGLMESNALLINGKLDNGILKVSSYVRVDRTP